MMSEAILNRLKSTLFRAKGVEALAFWASGDQWTDAMGESLENEEIVFYAEGLLMEGTRMAWQVIGLEGVADHLRLFFWQDQHPPLPAAPEGAEVLETVAFSAK